jgi:hypothetical protein
MMRVTLRTIGDSLERPGRVALPAGRFAPACEEPAAPTPPTVAPTLASAAAPGAAAATCEPPFARLLPAWRARSAAAPWLAALGEWVPEAVGAAGLALAPGVCWTLATEAVDGELTAVTTGVASTGVFSGCLASRCPPWLARPRARAVGELEPAPAPAPVVPGAEEAGCRGTPCPAWRPWTLGAG